MLSQLLFHLTGLPLFDGRLFRAGAAALLSALLIFWFMPGFTRFLRKIGATSDFDSQAKTSVPIMGGALIVPIIAVVTLAFSHFNSSVASLLIIMLAFFAVGTLDDLAKIINKRKVLAGKITRQDYQEKADGISARLRLFLYFLFSLLVAVFAYKFIPGMSGHLTVPFIKHEIWHPYLPNWAFIILICLVITSTANGANFTDGIDSLVSVPIITTALFFGFVAYISGNVVLAKYFLIPHLPGVDELFPFAAAIAGSLGAYLWFNAPPASIYLGDSGSIALGGAIGMAFVLIHAELFLPIVGFIFVAEALSVFLQISYFKLTRRLRADKQGQRLFLRAPIHHHFQIMLKDQYPNKQELNSKIAWRFHLVSLFTLLLGLLIFFKIR